MTTSITTKNEPNGRTNKRENSIIDITNKSEDSFIFTIFDLAILFLSVFSIISDLCTDLILVVQYSNQGYRAWAIGTFVLIFFPSLVVQFFSLRWHIVDKTASVLHWVLHFCMLGIVHRYVEIIKAGYAAYKSKKASDIQKVYLDQNDLCILHLFESFLESAPQLVLQMYVIAMLHEWRFWTGLSAFASLLSLSWALAAYTKAQRRARESKNSTTWPGLLLQAAWRTGMLTSRITTLVLAAYCFGNYLFILIGIHWLAMTVWIVYQKTDFCETYWEERIYNAVAGVIYCFCFFNLQEGQSRWRALAFYLIVVFQNLTCLTVFLMWFGDKAPKLAVSAFIAVIGGTILGAVSMLVYYGFFHPSGPIKFAFGVEEIHNQENLQAYSTLSLKSLKRNRNEIQSSVLPQTDSKELLKNESVIIIEEANHDDSDSDIKILENWINEEKDVEKGSNAYKRRAICSSVDLEKMIDSKSEILKTGGTDGSSEILSAHDYENLAAVNIARETWGLRSWKGYSDIETWLHDDSVVNERRLDTLTSTTSSDTLQKESDRTRQDEYIEAIAEDLAQCVSETSSDDILGQYSIDSLPIVYPLGTLDPIFEEIEESSSSTDFADVKIRSSSESTLVATIEEIRRNTPTQSRYSEVIFEEFSPNLQTKASTNWKKVTFASKLLTYLEDSLEFQVEENQIQESTTTRESKSHITTLVEHKNFSEIIESRNRIPSFDSNDSGTIFSREKSKFFATKTSVSGLKKIMPVETQKQEMTKLGSNVPSKSEKIRINAELSNLELKKSTLETNKTSSVKIQKPELVRTTQEFSKLEILKLQPQKSKTNFLKIPKMETNKTAPELRDVGVNGKLGIISTTGLEVENIEMMKLSPGISVVKKSSNSDTAKSSLLKLPKPKVDKTTLELSYAENPTVPDTTNEKLLKISDAETNNNLKLIRKPEVVKFTSPKKEVVKKSPELAKSEIKKTSETVKTNFSNISKSDPMGTVVEFGKTTKVLEVSQNNELNLLNVETVRAKKEHSKPELLKIELKTGKMKGDLKAIKKTLDTGVVKHPESGTMTTSIKVVNLKTTKTPEANRTSQKLLNLETSKIIETIRTSQLNFSKFRSKTISTNLELSKLEILKAPKETSETNGKFANLELKKKLEKTKPNVFKYVRPESAERTLELGNVEILENTSVKNARPEIIRTNLELPYSDGLKVGRDVSKIRPKTVRTSLQFPNSGITKTNLLKYPKFKKCRTLKFLDSDTIQTKLFNSSTTGKEGTCLNPSNLKTTKTSEAFQTNLSKESKPEPIEGNVNSTNSETKKANQSKCSKLVIKRLSQEDSRQETHTKSTVTLGKNLKLANSETTRTSNADKSFEPGTIGSVSDPNLSYSEVEKTSFSLEPKLDSVTTDLAKSEREGRFLGTRNKENIPTVATKINHWNKILNQNEKKISVGKRGKITPPKEGEKKSSFLLRVLAPPNFHTFQRRKQT